MHDGVYATLSDVLWHYNTGGRSEQAGAVGTPAAQLKPIGLTDAEVADLIAFLETLTGAPPASAGGADAAVAPPDAAAGGDASMPADAAVPDAPVADAGGPDAAGAPTAPVEVQAIFASRCVGCHPPQNGLALSSASTSYASLVRVAATGCTNQLRVVPGNASASYLIAKLRNRTPICGAPMPYGSAMLPEAQIQTIEAWINGLSP
jgi:hypothetical protein